MVASARRPSRHLRVEGEVVGLWFEVQAQLEAHFTRLAAEHGLSAVQAKVLMTLKPGQAVTMRALAGLLRYDASNLTGVIDRLEERGVVRRVPHASDRRVKEVSLSDEGAKLRLDFWTRLTGQSGPIGRLNDRELGELRTLLRSAISGGSRAADRNRRPGRAGRRAPLR